MKKIVFTLMYLCFLSLTIVAQDLNPGQQSQGLLESRNVTVDHCTGIFHYNIPLYTLKSGDYELPISLRYTGKGVKENDNPGLVGYNWTLDTGGVVTRTVRGGIPDEKEYIGYIHNESKTTSLWDDTLHVNRRLRDGESDIFTVQFKNQSVNFIIRKIGSEIHAEALDRTDISILCETDDEQCNSIRGWIITDSEGNRYTYRSKEWTVGLNRQEESGFNAVSNMDYVSSWYLTCIEPLNEKEIRFYYSCGETDRFCDTYYNETINEDIYYMKFEYGRYLEVPIFEFDAYKEEFNSYIEAALYHISDYNTMLSHQYQIEFQYQSTIDSLGMITNPTLEYISMEMEQNDKILGYASGFSRVSSHVSGGLLATLRSLEDRYRNTAPSASRSFSQAADLVERHLLGLNRVLKSTHYGNAGTFGTIYTPALKTILCDEKISFIHQENNIRLLDLKKSCLSGNLISSFRFSYEQDGSLSSVIQKDKNNENISVTSFNYYELQEGETVMSDMYGYKKRGNNTRDEIFRTELDEEYSKIGSLKDIIFPDGGHLHINYEQNEYIVFSEVKPYGGIRVRSLALYDSSKDDTDSICYEYEPGTIPVFEEPSYIKEKQYYGFADRIQYSRMLLKNNAILCPGNNGLYYNCVKETLPGRGSRVYHFGAPSTILGDKSYAYRFYGLPLFTIDLNENGKVIHLVQNTYYTDFMEESGLPFHFFCQSAESFTNLEALSYSMSLPQSILNEDYIDVERMEEYYRDMTNSPHNPSYRFFQQNILPRVLDRYETTNYTLYYGGATLLKEQRQYHSEGEYDDFRKLMEEKEPYKRIVYHYDNLEKHTRPGRIVTYNSQNDSIVTYYIYADDMEVTSSVNIAGMQTYHILTPVVKECVVRNGIIQNKSVTEYDFRERDNRIYCLPEKFSIHTEEDSMTFIPDYTILYDGTENEYVDRKKIDGDFVTAERFAPTHIFEEGEYTGYLYDSFTGKCLLCTSDTILSDLVAADVHLQAQGSNDTYDMSRILELSGLFWQGFLNLDREQILQPEYQSYCQSEDFRKGGMFMELLSQGKDGKWKRESLDNALASLDSISSYEEFPVCQLVNKHIEICQNWIEYNMDFPWNMTLDEMQELRDALYTAVYVHYGAPLRLHLLTYIGEITTASHYVPKVVRPSSSVDKYKLFLLTKETSGYVTYKVTDHTGTSHKTETFNVDKSGSIHIIDINPNEYNGITEISIVNFSGIRFFTLIPEGTEFEATSYNEDGTISIKFDHNGKMRHHEYDSAGRLIRVRDENGKTLEENDYHVKNTTL